MIGPSGSGKSSVVMAGLLPRLQQGALPGSDQWTILKRIQPDKHPLDSLADALFRAFPKLSLSALRDDLAHPNGRGLHDLARNLVRAGTRLVIYIDQFEEVFTQTANEADRLQFINLLTTAASEMGGTALVIFTLRADFYDRPLAYSELGKLVKAYGKAVLPLTLAELYEAIQKPAALPEANLTFDDGLVNELVFEVRDQPGGLPLLQFTLDLLFQQREGLRLTNAAYTANGGLRGALA